MARVRIYDVCGGDVYNVVVPIEKVGYLKSLSDINVLDVTPILPGEANNEQ